MMHWFRRMIHREIAEAGQTAEARDAIGEAQRVRREIDERIAFRHHEVAVFRLEQTRVRRKLILDAPLHRRNEDLPGALGRK